ncbi:MAG: hypothetical protein NZM25_01200 [Leptospiraceae bacterium]|nr:hypothetical protein [Leptospiraceae bacterium]MDW8306341.1 hypothetical protein [Leptospiraceae bacterium]
MSPRSLLRHFSILIILSLLLPNEIGWETALLWVYLNKNTLFIWLFGTAFLSITNLFLHHKGYFEQLSHYLGLVASSHKNLWGRLLLLLQHWSRCPKCTSYGMGALFSFGWMYRSLESFLASTYFALWGASFSALGTILFYLLLKTKDRKAED